MRAASKQGRFTQTVDGVSPSGKSRRANRSTVLRRFAKQMEQLADVVARVQDVQCPPGQDLTLLLLLGPSPSRPREAVELSLSGCCSTSHDVPPPGGVAPLQHRAPATAATGDESYKTLARMLRQVIPAVGRLPAPKSPGAQKLFVCVKAPRAHLPAEHFEEREALCCSLKTCVCVVVRTTGGPRSADEQVASASTPMCRSELHHFAASCPVLAAGGTRALACPTQAPAASALARGNSDRVWHLLRCSVKGLKCDM